jgi:glycosyltransferase involved in cell wall biosynthesis
MALKLVVTAPWGERLGGAENMLWHFLTGLDKERIKPLVVFFQGGPFEREIAGIGLETAVIPTGRLREVRNTSRAIKALAGILEREQPDLLLNWSPKAQLYGARAAARAGLRNRVAWWQHGLPEVHWIDRLATALPARAVGCSSNASARVQERLRPRRRTFVVHPGIPLPGSNSGDGAAAQLGIPESRTVLGILGRLQPWKGQDRFLQAVALLRERGLDVHGLIVGGDSFNLSPEYAASLEPLARRLGLAERVTITGYVEEPWPYLRAMDIFINASEAEPFGIAILEAMAAGVPVVAVGDGGPAEIIEPQQTGVLVDSGSPESLADGAAPLIEDSALRARLSAAASERARTRFSAAAMVETLTAELESLARQEP